MLFLSQGETVLSALRDDYGKPIKDGLSLRDLLQAISIETNEKDNPEVNRHWLEEILECNIPDDSSGNVVIISQIGLNFQVRVSSSSGTQTLSLCDFGAYPYNIYP